MKIWLQLGNVWGKRWTSGQVATGIKCQVQAHAIFIMATKANTDATRQQQHSSTWSQRLTSAHLTTSLHFILIELHLYALPWRSRARWASEAIAQINATGRWLLLSAARICQLSRQLQLASSIFHLLISHLPVFDHLHLTSSRQTDNSQMSQQALKLFILLSK